MKKAILILFSLLFGQTLAWSQEALSPVNYQPCLQHKGIDTTQVLLPFFDDFSDYQGAPRTDLWLSDQAFVNNDYDACPPTKGMVTLDGVDAQGALYAGASNSIFSGDTLASQPIRLDSLFSPIKKRLTPGDSLYLSFFYLPGGGMGDLWDRIGDCPDAMDSLFLEFYNPDSDCWQRVWCTPGISADTLFAHTGRTWQYVSVPVTLPCFFSPRFQFRFRNYCSLDVNPKLGMVGNSDQWNLDYIYLGTGRSHDGKYFRDVAFVGKAPSLLNDYQAIPYRHFNAGCMTPNLSVTITNLYSQTLATNYNYYIYSPDNQLLYRYDGGYENAPPFLPNGNYQTIPAHAAPPVNYAFPLMTEPSTFRVTHVITEGSIGDNHTCNDTMTFSQVFDNYYAYDDGVAENGYGLTSTSSKLFLACRFDIPLSDTLTAIDLCFNHTRNDENSNIPFYLCIWDDNNGKPGNLIYKDDIRKMSQSGELNQYIRYPLTQAQIVHGTIYIGLEQASNVFLNLGFDRSNDASNKIFYRTTTSWSPSILRGALMMRPCFGASALVGIHRPQQCLDLTLFPNPASDYISCQLPDMPNLYISIYDCLGHKVLSQAARTRLFVGNLPKGTYFLQLHNTNGVLATKKFVKE